MGEHALNERRGLTSASVSNADLQVDNGQIVDGGGNPVTLGEIEGDNEVEFGDPNRGVTRVKDATPTGSLEVDSSGNILVAGYGPVTLEHEWGDHTVSNVGGYNGWAATLKTDSSGRIYSQPTTSGSYSSDTLFVTNGDTTTHDTTTVDEPINITSSQVRWEGDEDTSTSTSYSTNTNSDSATATTTTTTSTVDSEDSATTPDDYTASTTFPTYPTGTDFDHHDMEYEVVNGTSSEQTVDVQYEDSAGNSHTQSVTVASGDFNEFYTESDVTTYYGGESREINIDISAPDNMEVYVYLHTTNTDTKIESKTASTTYPSVPNGYSFNRHHHQEWRGGTEEVNNYYYTNKVGESESITSNDTNTTVEVELDTRGEDTTTNTTDTEDPSVSNALSASYTGTIDNGVWTSWYSTGTFNEGNISIDHSIGGSNKANFQFEYTYESETYSVSMY